MRTTRRQFLKAASATGGALVLGMRLFADDTEAASASLEPNAWVSIHPDGSIVVRVGKSEMGQGVRTSLPMILAEELDADLEAVRIEQASPGPAFQGLGTGGSGSIVRSWQPLRNAGATARAMLISAAATQWNVDPASCSTHRGSVMHPDSGRKAGYGELASAAARLPVPADVPLKKRSDFSLIGQNRKRLDGPEIVTGRARYGLDVRVPGLHYAVIARPASFGAKLKSFDAKKAEKRTGVVRVFEVPSGIAVVATNSWAALRAREDLTIEWETGEGANFNSEAHTKALRDAANETGMTIRKDGEGAAALAGADRTIEALYEYGHQAHAPVEPVNCTVLFNGDECTVWSPTQTPNGVQAVAAHVLEIDPSKVHVNVMLLGGGFGRRLGFDFDREAVEVAKRMKGTPVQLLWSREDDMRDGYFQAASAHRLIAGVSNEGKVTAWVHRKASAPHNARSQMTEEEKKNPEVVRGYAWGVYDTPYHAPAMEMSYRIVEAPVPIGPWRSVFSPPSVFARESFVDELAIALDRDPIDLRMELLGRDDPEMPTSFEIGSSKVDRARLRQALEAVKKLSRWGGSIPKGQARGIAANIFHSGTHVAYVVDVSKNERAGKGDLPFRIERVFCAVDCGIVVNPQGVEQQVESGIAWSLSNMKGETTFRDGRAQELYYSDFRVAMIGDMPREIEVAIIPSDEDRPRGIGEPVVCPFAPAVANAWSRLTGQRVRRLPVV